jgi:hypothetical protein
MDELVGALISRRGRTECRLIFENIFCIKGKVLKMKGIRTKSELPADYFRIEIFFCQVDNQIFPILVYCSVADCVIKDLTAELSCRVQDHSNNFCKEEVNTFDLLSIFYIPFSFRSAGLSWLKINSHPAHFHGTNSRDFFFSSLSPF